MMTSFFIIIYSNPHWAAFVVSSAGLLAVMLYNRKKTRALTRLLNSSKVNWFVIGLVCVFASISLLYTLDPKSVIAKILLVALGEVGFAFILAYVFSRTVEKEARDEYNTFVKDREKVLGKNIFDYLYGIKVEQKLFEFIEEHIYKQPFIRKHMRIEYDFSEVKDGWILLRTEYNFVVRNVSQKPEIYTQTCSVEKILGSPPPDNMIDVPIHRFKIGDEELTESEIEVADRNAKDNSDFKVYSKDIEIPPNTEIEVSIVIRSPKLLRDSEHWRSSVVSDGLEITIRYDPKEFDIRLIAVHPNSGGMDIRNDDNKIFARISDPLLPKNGIYFWWCQNNEEPPKQKIKNKKTTLT